MGSVPLVGVLNRNSQILLAFLVACTVHVCACIQFLCICWGEIRNRIACLVVVWHYHWHAHIHTHALAHTQSGHFDYRGVPQALRSIWSTEGAKGMYLLYACMLLHSCSVYAYSNVTAFPCVCVCVCVCIRSLRNWLQGQFPSTIRWGIINPTGPFQFCYSSL